jgi:hypothetical protein
MPPGTAVNAHGFSPGSVDRRKIENHFSSTNVFQAIKWETRGRVRTPEALRGVQNIIAMKKY